VPHDRAIGLLAITSPLPCAEVRSIRRQASLGAALPGCAEYAIGNEARRTPAANTLLLWGRGGSGRLVGPGMPARL
jgi:hypothetical protein